MFKLKYITLILIIIMSMGVVSAVSYTDSLENKPINVTVNQSHINFYNDDFLNISLEHVDFFVPQELLNQLILVTPCDPNIMVCQGPNGYFHILNDWTNEYSNQFYIQTDYLFNLEQEHWNPGNNIPEGFGYKRINQEIRINYTEENIGLEQILETGIQIDANTKIEIELKAHYNHLIINYIFIYNNETVGTFEDVYSGEKPELLPAHHMINRIKRQNRTELKYFIDNLYNEEKYINITIAYPNNKEIKNISFEYVEEIIPHRYNEAINNLLTISDGNSQLQNPEDFNFRTFKVLLKENEINEYFYSIKAEDTETNIMGIWVEGSGSGAWGDPEWNEVQPAGNTNAYWRSFSMSSNGSVILAGSTSRLYLSDDTGSTWSEVQPAGNVNRNWYTSSMSSDGSVIIAGVNSVFGKGLYLSDDTGSTWSEIQPAGDFNLNWATSSMSSDGSVIIVGFGSTNSGRLYLSNDTGDTWSEVQPLGNVDRNWATSSMSSDGSVIIAGVYSSTNGRLYLSNDTGDTWSQVQPVGNINREWFTSGMSSDGSVIIAGVFSSTNGRLYLSDDTGDTWSQVQPAGNVNLAWRGLSMSSNGEVIIANVWGGRVYLSDDTGSTWSQTQPTGNADRLWWPTSMSSNGSLMLVAYNNGRVYLGEQEVLIPTPPNKPTLNYPTNASTNIELSPTLNVTVTHDLETNMNVSFYYANHTLIGTNNNVANNTQTTKQLENLTSNTQYQWYVNATNTDGTTQSDVWSFTTELSLYDKLYENMTKYFKLDETTGTNAENSINTSFNMTATNAAVFTTEREGIINTGGEFISHRLTQPNNLIADIRNDHTYSLWVEVDSMGDANIISQRASTTTGNRNVVLYFVNGYLRYYIREGTTSVTFQRTFQSADIFEANTLYHIVLTVNQNNVKLYVNGTEKTMNTLSGSVGGTWQNPLANSRGFGASRTGTSPLNGMIDEYITWENRILTQEEAELIYNEQKDGYTSGQYPFTPVEPVEPPEDTCECPGLNQNWEVNMQDHCVITTTCNIGTGRLSFINTGNLTINSAVTIANMDEPITGQTIYIGTNAILTI